MDKNTIMVISREGEQLHMASCDISAIDELNIMSMIVQSLVSRVDSDERAILMRGLIGEALKCKRFKTTEKGLEIYTVDESCK